jgi:hypothetical protein
LPGSAGLFMETPTQALTKLMNAFYGYGRLHFRWEQSGSPMAAAPGLLKGAATGCACSTFARNLRWLAVTICDIHDLEIELPSYEKPFLTTPYSDCIDSHWLGNVRTKGQDFATYKCFKFTSHYWLKHGTEHYDVCFNKVCTNEAEIVATKLVKYEGPAAKVDTVFALKPPTTETIHGEVHPLKWLVMAHESVNGSWPTWVMPYDRPI